LRSFVPRLCAGDLRPLPGERADRVFVQEAGRVPVLRGAEDTAAGEREQHEGGSERAHQSGPPGLLGAFMRYWFVRSSSSENQ
jgi:hypothetical protein